MGDDGLLVFWHPIYGIDSREAVKTVVNINGDR